MQHLRVLDLGKPGAAPHTFWMFASYGSVKLYSTCNTQQVYQYGRTDVRAMLTHQCQKLSMAASGWYENSYTMFCMALLQASSLQLAASLHRCFQGNQHACRICTSKDAGYTGGLGPCWAPGRWSTEPGLLSRAALQHDASSAVRTAHAAEPRHMPGRAAF